MGLNQNHSILVLDVSGNPHKWVDVCTAVHYYATGHVSYDFGDNELVLHGGFQNSGEQSTITVKSMICINGNTGKRKPSKIVSQKQGDMLFRRDRNVCAYCGDHHEHERHLTKDHIVPRSRGGDNSWVNLVTSCVRCNNLKDDRTPEEAKMTLLYVPYVPCLHERFILSNRRILFDQMSFLQAKLPSHSRLNAEFLGD